MRSQVKSAPKPVNNAMTAGAVARQLARQEAELDARRNLLKHEIAHEVRDGRDSAEWSFDQSTFGVNAAVLEATARTMRNIEDAMDRLNTKSFGLCIECDHRIPPVRLEALPFAERCRVCQEHLDEEERQKTEEFFRPLF
ncbi:MAG: TraR/DksA C4-type zinc finger protein [Vicinamibacteria bacterium]